MVKRVSLHGAAAHCIIWYIHVALQRTQDKAGHKVFKHTWYIYIYKALWSRLHTFFIQKLINKFHNPLSFTNEPFSVVLVPFWLSSMLILFVCLHSALQATNETSLSRFVGSNLYLLIADYCNKVERRESSNQHAGVNILACCPFGFVSKTIERRIHK